MYVLVNKVCNFQVETGVVNKNDTIRLPANDLLFACFYALQYFAEVHDNCDITHVCQFRMVIIVELCFLILSLELLYQSGRMQVSACFTCDQKVTHSRSCPVSMV